MTKGKDTEQESARFALYVEKLGCAKRAQADQVPLQEPQLVNAVLDYANRPERPDGPTELTRRVAGWLGQMIELRNQPKKLDDFNRRAFASWSPMAREVDVTPVFEIDRGRVTVSQVVDGGHGSSVIAYGLLLLMDEARGYGRRLCQCRVCGEFFLLKIIRGRAGRKARLYCYKPGHRLRGEKEAGRLRQAKHRKGKG